MHEIGVFTVYLLFHCSEGYFGNDKQTKYKLFGIERFLTRVLFITLSDFEI